MVTEKIVQFTRRNFIEDPTLFTPQAKTLLIGSTRNSDYKHLERLVEGLYKGKRIYAVLTKADIGERIDSVLLFESEAKHRKSKLERSEIRTYEVGLEFRNELEKESFYKAFYRTLNEDN